MSCSRFCVMRVPWALPVAPDAHGAVVDVVAAEDDVDRGVQLDAGDLGAAELHHVVDVVDVVVLNDGEHRAHAADDAALLAVVDVAAAHDVAAHILLQPAVILAAAHGVALHLGGALHVLHGEVVVVVRVKILAQRDAGALAVADLAVLDDPALGPVRADHAVLVGGGRRPSGGGLVDVEAAHGDVANARLGGHEALAAHVDLHVLLVRVLAVEVGVNHGLAAVLFGVPLPAGRLRLPGVGVHLGLQAFLDAGRLIKRLVVQIHRARVLAAAGKVPVAVDIGGVGVVAAEDAVVHTAHPHVALIGLPALDLLRAGDHGAQRLLAAVGDARVRRAGVLRIYILAVDAGGHHDLVARAGNLRRVADALERRLLRAVAVTRRFCVDVKNHCCFLPFSGRPPSRARLFQIGLIIHDFGSPVKGMGPLSGLLSA